MRGPFMSITRFHASAAVEAQFVAVVIWLSIRAESRLCASPMAPKSPVKCRLMSSSARLGRSGRRPRRLHAENGPEARFAQADDAFLPILSTRRRGLRWSWSCLAGGRGTQSVTRSTAVGLVLRLASNRAISSPCNGRSSDARGGIPRRAAISEMGFMVALWAISIIGTHF